MIQKIAHSSKISLDQFKFPSFLLAEFHKLTNFEEQLTKSYQRMKDL